MPTIKCCPAQRDCGGVLLCGEMDTRWIRNVSRRDLTDGLTSASAAYRVWFGFRHRGISINEQSQRLCCASDIAAAGQNYLVPISHICCVLNPLAISLHLALC